MVRRARATVNHAAVYWLDFFASIRGCAFVRAMRYSCNMRWRASVLPNLPICWLFLGHSAGSETMFQQPSVKLERDASDVRNAGLVLIAGWEIKSQAAG